jgi:hypothetical protein
MPSTDITLADNNGVLGNIPVSVRHRENDEQHPSGRGGQQQRPERGV